MVVNFTKRMNRIMRNAEKEADASTDEIMKPGHLLIACLHERGGAMGEIYIKGNFDLFSIRRSVNELEEEFQPAACKSPLFHRYVTKEIDEIMELATRYMDGYNQIYMNEGHLLKALIVTHSIEELITTKQQRLLLNMGTTSRDMIVHLETYKKPDIHLNIRRAKSNDRDQLIQFVRDYFSEGWANTINEGLLKDEPSIYIAFNEVEDVIGFAAFDVYQGKKNYFGPMGVLTGERTKGIGFSLLHSCLSEMKEIGYGYAIIGGAGPLEFYETVCNAVVIPYPYEEWDG